MQKFLPGEVLPTYNTANVNGKKRRVRLFGDVRLIKATGEIKVLSQRGYMFIKNEPNTIYTAEANEGVL